MRLLCGINASHQKAWVIRAIDNEEHVVVAETVLIVVTSRDRSPHLLSMTKFRTFTNHKASEEKVDKE